jgi:hypothetical protein
VAKNPSTRWYFNDWRNDTAVMACSDAAQGFWAWLLCICAEEGGYLRIGGRSPTVGELAHLRGRDKRTIARQLAELEHAGVFSRTEDGTIFNRRMVRDFEGYVARHGKSRGRAHASARDGVAQESRLKKKKEGSDNEKGNPLGRCAPLGGSFGGRCHPEPGPDAEPYVPLGTVRPRSPPCRKSPALKAQIRGQLAWKHVRYLTARGRPGEAESYFELIDAKTMVPPQEVFDAVDYRMRSERWDDAWEHEEAA